VRLGLDLLLEPTTLTGTGVYARNLVRALAAIDRTNEYVLFLHHDNLPAFYIDAAANFRCQGYKFNAARPIVRRLAQQLMLAAGSRRLGLDLLHSFTDIAPLLYRGPLVLTVHDLGPFATPDRYGRHTWCLRALMARSAKRAAAIIAVSGHTRADINAYLPRQAGKVTVVPHGVDARLFRPQEGPGDRALLEGLGIGGDYILFVGRLERGKNVSGLLGAYQRLPGPVRRHFSLVLAGPDDNEAAAVRRLAAGIQGRVVFTGYLGHDRLPALYRHAAALVLPSIYEGFGLPVLEAMACGTPVVATRVSSLPEVIGEAGILVAPGDTADLTRALERLCTDAALRADLAARGLERAGGFSWEAAARRTLDVYCAIRG